MPYSFAPRKVIQDLQSPEDLYTWLTKIFVPVTFAEQPRNGDLNGFCTVAFPCRVNQGDCDRDSMCTGNLTCGDKSTAATGVRVNG
eukprot:CAMPEP_0170632244 /NCGR_PEP_ID=MMETSP0224-20130122/35212_1 /TAXON_ID=285029 /ORGANISM="Togula jolla, Strain CCCM 725" /LENGTH=85 /DNA_ID=CAMNT_0010960919 /DNA_START=98 /DNA_END=351 /DNA_ORIENTATION=+